MLVVSGEKAIRKGGGTKTAVRRTGTGVLDSSCRIRRVWAKGQP